jgi:hypothetical protein
MYLNSKASLVFACAAVLSVLWIVVERKNWRLGWRVSLGLGVVICVSQVAVCLCHLKAAIREHYYRTALFSLAHEASEGNTNLVCKLLVEYGHKAKKTHDISAVINLSQKLMQVEFQRSYPERADEKEDVSPSPAALE